MYTSTCVLCHCLVWLMISLLPGVGDNYVKVWVSIRKDRSKSDKRTFTKKTGL